MKWVAQALLPAKGVPPPFQWLAWECRAEGAAPASGDGPNAAFGL